MTTFVTDDRITAEKDGSLTVNVNGGSVELVNKDLTDESFDRTASHMAGEYVSYPAKTLTDEEIMDLWVKHLVDDIHVFARAVLKKANEK
jgi:type II secretory pathway predicted ATPase ExeA